MARRAKTAAAAGVIMYACERDGGMIAPDTEKDFEVIVSGRHMYPQPVV